MTRITMAQLEAVVARINRMTKSPGTTYTKDAHGKFRANIGNYHLDGAYGGWALYRIANEGGACPDVLKIGHASKRELYHAMHAFIAGLEAAEEGKTA